jgi:hypothetical protein
MRFFTARLLLYIFLLSSLSSCRNHAHDAELYKAIDENYNSLGYKQVLYLEGGTGAIWLPKKDIVITTDPLNEAEADIRTRDSLLERLAFHNWIILGNVQRDSEMFYSTAWREIIPRKECLTYLLEEDSTSYYFKTFDFGGYRILDVEENDSILYVTFKIDSIINKTPLYEVLNPYTKDYIQKRLNDTLCCNFLKRKTGLRGMCIIPHMQNRVDNNRAVTAEERNLYRGIFNN